MPTAAMTAATPLIKDPGSRALSHCTPRATTPLPGRLDSATPAVQKGEPGGSVTAAAAAASRLPMQSLEQQSLGSSQPCQGDDAAGQQATTSIAASHVEARHQRQGQLIPDPGNRVSSPSTSQAPAAADQSAAGPLPLQRPAASPTARRRRPPPLLSNSMLYHQFVRLTMLYHEQVVPSAGAGRGSPTRKQQASRPARSLHAAEAEGSGCHGASERPDQPAGNRPTAQQQRRLPHPKTAVASSSRPVISPAAKKGPSHQLVLRRGSAAAASASTDIKKVSPSKTVLPGGRRPGASPDSKNKMPSHQLVLRRGSAAASASTDVKKGTTYQMALRRGSAAAGGTSLRPGGRPDSSSTSNRPSATAQQQQQSVLTLQLKLKKRPASPARLIAAAQGSYAAAARRPSHPIMTPEPRSPRSSPMVRGKGNVTSPSARLQPPSIYISSPNASSPHPSPPLLLRHGRSHFSLSPPGRMPPPTTSPYKTPVAGGSQPRSPEAKGGAYGPRSLPSSPLGKDGRGQLPPWGRAVGRATSPYSTPAAGASRPRSPQANGGGGSPPRDFPSKLNHLKTLNQQLLAARLEAREARLGAAGEMAWLTAQLPLAFSLFLARPCSLHWAFSHCKITVSFRQACHNGPCIEGCALLWTTMLAPAGRQPPASASIAAGSA